MSAGHTKGVTASPNPSTGVDTSENSGLILWIEIPVSSLPADLLAEAAALCTLSGTPHSFYHSLPVPPHFFSLQSSPFE